MLACWRRVSAPCRPHCLLLAQFGKVTVLLNHCQYELTFSVFTYFGKTADRRGSEVHAEKSSTFVLSSHLDLNGDRNDVR